MKLLFPISVPIRNILLRHLRNYFSTSRILFLTASDKYVKAEPQIDSALNLQRRNEFSRPGQKPFAVQERMKLHSKTKDVERLK